MRASRDFRRSRCGAASKIAPDHIDARLEEFVAVLEVFENHEMLTRGRGKETGWD
jgi:hypothetical protein